MFGAQYSVQYELSSRFAIRCVASGQAVWQWDDNRSFYNRTSTPYAKAAVELGFSYQLY